MNTTRRLMAWHPFERIDDVQAMTQHIGKQHAALLGVLAAGLLVRVIFLVETAGTGLQIVDEQHYYQLASSLFSGIGFAWGPDKPTSIRPPLYPGFLALVWTVIGEKSLIAVRGVQIVISLVNVVLLYQLGRRIFSQRVALVAATIFCFYPSIVAFNFLLLSEVLFTCLLTAFLLLAVRLIQTNKGWMALGAGLTLGLAALTRSIVWPFPLVLCPLAFLTLSGSKATRLKLSAVLLLGYLMIVAPWAVRNTNLQGVFTVVNSMGGITLLMGNYEHTPMDRAWDPMTLHGEASIYALMKKEHPESIHWTEGQKEQWAKQQAVAFMVQNPGLTLHRSLIKFASFWGLERTVPAGFQAGLYHPPAWFAMAVTFLVPIVYAWVMILACFGLFWGLPEERRAHWLMILLIAVVSGLHSLVFGHSRYHLPLMPLLILYAASALVQHPWHRFREGLVKAAGPVFACLVLFVAWGREVFVVEADRIRGLLQSLMG